MSWRAALGVALLGVAAILAILRIVADFVPNSRPTFVAPVPLELAAHMRPVGAVPGERGGLPGHNLLLLTLDTTRADRLRCYGNRDIETPNLDRLAHTGVLFTRAYAPAPVTLPSHGSILTGLYPYHHGARMNALSHLDESNVTLAEVLADAGYVTAAFVSAFVLHEQFGTAQGFEVFDYEGEQSTEFWGAVAERPADQTCDRALAWLRGRADAAAPFFLWVHFFDPHWDYRAPSPYAERYRDMPYDGEIAFMDAQVGRILDALDAIGMTERTLVVAAGDHGEGLFQHDEATHGALVYDSTLHVPLLMACGETFGGGVHFDRVVSLVDIVPTVLTMLGLEHPPGLDGSDLTGRAATTPTIFAETLEGLAEYGWAPLLAIREGELKYIHAPQPELYEVDVDPHEARNVAERRAAVAGALRARLEQFYGGDLAGAATVDVARRLTAEEQAKLESLGYLVGRVEIGGAPGERPDPKEMLPLLRRVGEAFQMQREDWLEHAIRELEDLTQKHPDFYLAHRELGTAYKINTEYDKAIRALQRSLELRPNTVVPLQALAEVHDLKGDRAAAREYYRRVLALYPDHFLTLRRLGQLLLEDGDVDEANALLARAHRIVPGDAAAVILVSTGLEAAGRRQAAMVALEETLAIRPDAPVVRNRLARYLKDAGRHEEAIGLLREGLKLDPDYLDFSANLAMVLLQKAGGGREAAEEAAMVALRICERTEYENAGYVHVLSRAYAQLGRYAEAAGLAERARQLAVGAGRPELAEQIAVDAARFRQAARESAEPAAADDGGEK
jgi:arylsulfatase A-like enzyme/predicted Zn-dependent protease